jgi:hypothetical protein
MLTQKTEIETPWMTTSEAAAYLRRSPLTLANWRREKAGPPWHQPGGEHGNIIYHRDELDAWQRGRAVPISVEVEEKKDDPRHGPSSNGPSSK